MTENTNENELTFEGWERGQTRATESVDILQDGDLSGRWAEWVRRYERAAADEVDESELLVGEKSKTAILREEGAKLIAEMDAARTTWFVHGIDSDTEAQIAKDFPWPENPIPEFTMEQPILRHGATDSHMVAFRMANENYWKAHAKHEAKYAIEEEKYTHELAEVAKERGYVKVSIAFVRATQGGKTVFSSLTVDQAKRLNQLIGDIEFSKILNAINKASQKSEPIPGDADFLSITSAKTTV